MAGDERGGDPAIDVTEERLLSRLRRISVGVILLMVVLLVVVDTIGRLLVPGFHASELFFGTLVGALLMLLGIEGITKLPGLRK